MRFELISDNTDTLIGMRLAGITGVMADTPEKTKAALLSATQKEDVAIVLITEKLVTMCKDVVYELKNTCKRPLIVQIPDGEPDSKTATDSLAKYIRDAVGLKI